MEMPSTATSAEELLRPAKCGTFTNTAHSKGEGQQEDRTRGNHGSTEKKSVWGKKNYKKPLQPTLLNVYSKSIIKTVFFYIILVTYRFTNLLIKMSHSKTDLIQSRTQMTKILMS